MKKIFMPLIFLAAIVSMGCSLKPLQNVADEPVITASGKTPTMDEVSKSIMRAGVGLGWTIKPLEAGHMLGTLNLREHTAVVDIRYTVKMYSITYKDSTNLNYDGSNIHRNYNGWIQNLNKRIRAQLIEL